MNSEERYVFDANVIISALLFNASVPGQVFVRALEHGTILVSQSLVEELSDVLRRNKFNRYVTREERERFLESLIRESEVVEITDEVQACRDPKDDRILERRHDNELSRRLPRKIGAAAHGSKIQIA